MAWGHQVTFRAVPVTAQQAVGAAQVPKRTGHHSAYCAAHCAAQGCNAAVSVERATYRTVAGRMKRLLGPLS